MNSFDIENIANESDVEQKFLQPLLTRPLPTGLGYSYCDFRTKPDLRQIELDKGTSKKLYYPDYIIVLHGIPVLVIEAKSPQDSDLDSALREARLYAHEINALFPVDFNPCQKIIVSNGARTICTHWDSSQPVVDIKYEDIDAMHPNLAKLVTFAAKTELQDFADALQRRKCGALKFDKPTSLLGGYSVRYEELNLNTFGNTLALEYRHLFNPVTPIERKLIVQNAYVASKRRLRHVDPIDRIIRAAKPPSVTDAHEIEESDKPQELFDKLRDHEHIKNELLILIGGVGSGKSTFVDYLRHVALPDDIKGSTVWVSLDLNNAPLSREAIYPWLKKEIISELRTLHESIDFDELTNLEKLYGVELNKVRKGPASYFDENSIQYKELLSKELSVLQKDWDATLNAFVRYLCVERGKLLIVLLDNCDKRGRDDQLLLFDVAKWLQRACRCLVFLPIRDTTYDHHRLQPPLDTVIKDLVFRIDAPLFMDVLYKRVDFALRQMEKDGREKLCYTLPNGIRVEYPQSEQGYYLACMLRSLFQNDELFRRIVSGIAGTDIRRGLEIFMDFCKSGHIQEDEIFKIRQSRGEYVLPGHIVTRVLFRGNRRYYHDTHSLVKNLFASYVEDVLPDPLARIAILRWLISNYRMKGPNGIIGYHKISRLVNELVPYGHDERRLSKEVEQLIRAGCIAAESQETESITSEDLICISPSGHVHLNLLTNLDYLATCAEDVWFSEADTAKHIAERIIGKEGTGHMSMLSSVGNAEDLLTYITGYRAKYLSNPNAYLADSILANMTNLDDCIAHVRTIKEKNDPKTKFKELESKYPPGTEVECQITAIKKYGLFVEFGLNAAGYISINEFHSAIRPASLLLSDYDTGDIIRGVIVKFNPDHGRFNLRPILS